MASRVKDIRKIGAVNKGLSLTRPKSSSGVIAPEFLLGTRGPVTVDENGAVSRKVAANILTASFDGFSLSDLGQRIEEQRRELARERQQTFGGILSDVQGLSNNLLLERNKAEADRQRSVELEQRNKELEALLQALQQQLLQQQKQQQQQHQHQQQQQQQQQQQDNTRNQSQKTSVTQLEPVVAQERRTVPPATSSSSSSSSSTLSVGVQCSSSITTSEVQTDDVEPETAFTDNFVWCKSCEEKSSALESVSARLQHSVSQLSSLQSAVAVYQQQEKEHSSAKRALSLQVEQLQNLLLLESGRAAQIQNASESQLSAASEQLDEQKFQHQQQLDAIHLRCREVETQLEAVTQEHLVTRQALDEALRESSAAAAIEQHVKSKLAAAEATVKQQKVHLDQQLAAFAQERSDFEQRLVQRDAAVQQAQAQVAELRQRFVAIETQHTKESSTKSLSSSTHEREVVVIDKTKTSSSAPLAGGGGASVIINVSSDTQIQTLNTRLKETEEVKTKLEIELRVTRFNLERDAADARSQVAAMLEAEKKSVERAKAADKKLEEAKIVFSASKQEAAALQTKIKSLTAELSSVQAQLKQASAALAEETRLRLQSAHEVEALKSQTAAASTSLEEQIHSVKTAHAESKFQAEKLQGVAQALQEEVVTVRSAAAAEIKSLEAKLVETEAALLSQTAELKLRLNAAESSCSVQQQQLQMEVARQEKERAFVEQKLARLEEQQSAAAAAQSAAAAACADAERAKAAASERSAAVAAVFKKMANLDEGLEGDCTCLQCLQPLAEPMLLQCGHSLCSSCSTSARACAECDAAISQASAGHICRTSAAAVASVSLL